MKLNNHPFRTVALLLLVMLAAACTGEDDFAAPPDEGTASAAPLTITVTDGAYAPAQSPDGGNTPDTRAVEHEYGTEFTKGDQIGLYVVKKEDAFNPADTRRAFVHQNLCLTHDGTGWTLPDGTVLTHQPPKDGEILYFAYYPYQEDMAHKVDIYAQEEGRFTTEARYFFGKLINDWTPADDQSTYEAYTASDLMVARGEVAKRTDGTDGSVLSFTMKHQMVLNIIRVPMTKYTYEETINGEATPMSCRLYSGLDILYSGKTFKGWMVNDNTYRYLVKPGSKNTIEGSYYNPSLEKKNFKGTFKPGSPGKYVLLTVDEGKETVIERALQIGDFYMNDGTIIPQGNITDNMPADVQANCLGVVFWVGESEGYHWTLTDNRKGDRLLMRDHPGCVHGMVVALKDANQGAGAAWATGSAADKQLYDWARNFGGFNAEESADWSEIKESAVTRYGYCMSHLVRLYSTYNTTATFPAYNTISDYAALHPAPVSSSGWFMPGRGELAMMCYGKAGNFEDKNTARRDLLNGLFPKAGGEVFAGSYWSIYDMLDKAWYLDFEGATAFGAKPKSDSYKVRAVLAF